MSVPILSFFFCYCRSDTYRLLLYSTPLLLLDPNASNDEGTYTHDFISFIIKIIFGV